MKVVFDCWADDSFAQLGPWKVPIPWPIASMLGSSMAKVFGRAVYGGGKRPITKAFFRVFKRGYDFKWWLLHRVHPKHRHHIVNTGLPPGYYDEDTLILHASMAMLERYIEFYGGPKKLLEFGEQLRSTDHNEHFMQLARNGQAEMQDEATTIYLWWKNEKPAMEAEYEEKLMTLYGDRKLSDPGPPREDAQKLWDTEELMKAKEDEMLIRLMKIRRSLWT